ncbi:hypothetical protein ACX0G9_02945 [Flavitalea flava]
MEDSFIITVQYKGADRDFESVLLQQGYTHKFQVNVEGTDVYFERDEEGSYRAILPPMPDGVQDLHKAGHSAGHMDISLLKLIAAKIEEILA